MRTGKIIPYNTGLVSASELTADGTYSGMVEDGIAGEALSFGNLVYFAVANSRWYRTAAGSSSTSIGKLGMCILAAGGAGSVTKILLWGKIRADSAFPTLTIGADVYLSTTTGSIQTTAPTGTNIVRSIGYGDTSDLLFFCPGPYTAPYMKFTRGGTFVNTVDYITSGLNVPVWYATCPCRVINVKGYRVGGTSATVNARKNGSSTHLTSAVSLTNADTWYDGGSVINTDYNTGDKLEIMVATVGGNITQISVQVDFIRLGE